MLAHWDVKAEARGDSSQMIATLGTGSLLARRSHRSATWSQNPATRTRNKTHMKETGVVQIVKKLIQELSFVVL